MRCIHHTINGRIIFEADLFVSSFRLSQNTNDAIISIINFFFFKYYFFPQNLFPTISLAFHLLALSIRCGYEY